MIITFSVPCVPVAQPRQRHRVLTVAGRTFAQNYTPTEHPVQAFKGTVRLAAHDAYQGAPLQGPLMLTAVFLMPRPGRLRWKNKPMPRCWHHSKPDGDNLAKALKDSLKGLVWLDDSQVAAMYVRKLYAAGDEQPHVEVEVKGLDEP